ncbi:MAG TPA: hypothetical protein VJ720_04810 [Chitinophaga sp.]|nr:hypothetical protein [Chitinophaga sp.]
MKKMLPLLFSIFFINLYTQAGIKADTTGTPSCNDAANEPNNSLYAPTLIPVDTDIWANLYSNEDADYYIFSTQEYVTVKIVLNDAVGNQFFMDLYSTDGGYIYLKSTTNNGAAPDTISYNAYPGIYYIIKVGGYSSLSYDSTCYKLRVRVQVAPECEDQYENNDIQDSAATIAIGQTITSRMISTTDVDYYKFSISTPSHITAILGNLPGNNPPNGTYSMDLLDSSGTQIHFARHEEDGYSAHTDFYGAKAGTYYLRVQGFPEAPLTLCYNLTVNTTPSGICSEAYEPNDTEETAAPVSVNSEILAQLTWEGDEDYYTFTTNGQPGFDVVLHALRGDYRIYLYDETWSHIALAHLGYYDDSVKISHYTGGDSRTYYVQVSPYVGGGSSTLCYRLNIRTYSSARQAAPALAPASREPRPGKMFVYPVPTTGTVYLETTGNGEGSRNITVSDMTGKVLFSRKYGIVTGYNRLEVILPSSLPNGPYIITDGKTSRKVILQR